MDTYSNRSWISRVADWSGGSNGDMGRGLVGCESEEEREHN